MDWGNEVGSPNEMPREVVQTLSFRGRRSRNKVSVGEPAEGSLTVSFHSHPLGIVSPTGPSFPSRVGWGLARRARAWRRACARRAGPGPREGSGWLAAWVCRAVGPGREPWCRRRRAASTRRSCARAAFGGACALVLERARPRAVDRSGWVAHPRCRVPLFSIGEGGLPSSGVRGLRPLTCLWSGTARVSSRHPLRGAAAPRAFRIAAHALQSPQLLPMDILALATMKNAAKCDT